MHPSKVQNTTFIGPFYGSESDHFTKTGSEQTSEKLRERALCAGVKLGGGAAWHNVSSASGTHLDIEVTFKGLTALPATSRATFQPTVIVFAGAGGSGGHSISWSPLPSLDETDNIDGNADSGDWVNGTAGGGPLALRLSQDTLAVRVLVDASVVEAFWDGGRARYTAHASAAGSPDATNDEGGAGGGGAGVMVRVSAGAGLKEGLISADIDVYEMASMWLS